MLEKDTNAMTLTFESPADSELPQKNKVFTPSMYDRAKGLLFVGDPHLSQRRPGRRVESDEEILAVTLDKLDQCIALANARHGVVVILGDLFDKSKGNSEKMLTRLFYILRKAEHPVYCLAGNHDLLASEVTDDTALAAVEAAGLIHVIRGQGKWFASFAIEDQRVWCGANLHDEALPRAVARPDEADQVLWFTHHDIAFEGHYPSSLEPHAISGVDWVINGHMHRTQPKVVKERTTWFNPGNIFRQTIADAKHVPSAWWWVPGEQPEQLPLRYIEQVFDWTGRHIKAQLSRDGDDAQPVAEEGEISFVRKLQAALSSELPKTSTGDVLLEDMAEVEKQLQPRDEILQIVQQLHARIAKATGVSPTTLPEETENT